MAFFRVLSLQILLPLLFLPLLSAHGLLMFPVLTVMLLSKLPQMYTFGIHYSVPLLPILFLSLLYGLANLRKMLGQDPRAKTIVHIIAIALLAINASNSNLWRNLKPERYDALKTRAPVIELIERIPPTASVAAQSALIPHIRKRSQIDMLPLGMEHEYIVVHAGVNLWPYTKEEFQNLLRELENSEKYLLLGEAGEARLYTRNPEQRPP